MTDADIDDYIDEAIDEISRHAPAWVPASLETIADEESYLLPKDIYDVCFCYYVRGLSEADIFGEGFEVLDDTLMYDTELHTYDRFIHALTKRQIQSNYDWDFNAYDHRLYLIPPPTTTGDKVYYVGLKKWTFDTIPTRFEKYIQMYGVHRVLEQYGRTQRRETAVAHTGDSKLWDMASDMLSDSRRVKTEFDQYMTVEGKKMAVFLGD